MPRTVVIVTFRYNSQKKTVILPLSGIVCLNDAASICEPNAARVGIKRKLDEIKIKPAHPP